jgi:hypothetical protein
MSLRHTFHGMMCTQGQEHTLHDFSDPERPETSSLSRLNGLPRPFGGEDRAHRSVVDRRPVWAIFELITVSNSSSIEILEPWEVARAARYRRPDWRDIYVRRHVLAREWLASLYEVDARDVRILPSGCRYCESPEHGPPYALVCGARHEFSMSSSGRLIAYASARERVGIDIERCSRDMSTRSSRWSAHPESGRILWGESRTTAGSQRCGCKKNRL